MTKAPGKSDEYYSYAEKKLKITEILNSYLNDDPETNKQRREFKWKFYKIKLFHMIPHLFYIFLMKKPKNPKTFLYLKFYLS